MLLIISLIFISLGLLLFLSKFITRHFNRNYPTKLKKTSHNYAVLIPARDESNVIEELIKSLEAQSMKIDNKDIYVIVENKSDKTIDICKKHKINCYIRKDLSIRRKGAALKELIEIITKEKEKEYDAYFIFDADNILDKDYFKEITKTYDKGYDIGIGYRNIKNKDNSISISSALIFTIINVLSNKDKAKYTLNCNASGTGFYISGRVINEFKTYPFTTLTEDYELSMYACINNLTTYYNDKAEFFDEQPNTFKQYFDQRTRWVKGYFETRKKYLKQLFKKFSFKNKNNSSIYESIIGIYDILLIIIGVFLLAIDIIFIGKNVILNILILLLLVYLVLIILTIYLLIIEKRFKIKTSLKIKTVFVHPFLLVTYIFCLIKVICVRNIEWKKIEHNRSSK